MNNFEDRITVTLTVQRGLFATRHETVTVWWATTLSRLDWQAQRNGCRVVFGQTIIGWIPFWKLLRFGALVHGMFTFWTLDCSWLITGYLAQLWISYLFLSVPVMKKHVWLLPNCRKVWVFEWIVSGQLLHFLKLNPLLTWCDWIIHITRCVSQEVIRAEAKSTIWT